MSSQAGPSRSYSQYSDGKAGILNEDEEEVFDPGSIDPELRLRTTQTAHSVIAESIRLEHAQEKRKRRRLFSTFRRNRTGKVPSILGSIKEGRSRAGTIVSSDFGQSLVEASASTSTAITAGVPALPAPVTKNKPSLLQRMFNTAQGKTTKTLERRSIYVNIPLPPSALHKGEPIMRYVRNKVRTAKYTIITFLPRNLFEQFRRVANIYFLGLVILQLFPIFGAPNGQIGMLPLLAILGMTAIKDAIEDWRRSRQDDQVNNSATTKLGGWRNVNQPSDPREWYEKFVKPAPGKPSKGVQKLRQLEAEAANQIVLDSVPHKGASDIYRAQSRASATSKRSVGVMDWSTHTPGTANWERTLW
jgi:phospholipid-translocating ATPase